MSTSELIERIKALPPRELAAVAAYVRALPSVGGSIASGVPDPLAARIVARRERLRAKFGTFSVHADIQELREDGRR